MKVALLQVASPDDESPLLRRRRIDHAVLGESALTEVDLLVLPELWGAGYFHFEGYAADAEPLAGRTLELASTWARHHSIRVHAGSFIEEGPQGDLFNTSLVMGRDGSLAAVYRKVHLFGHRSLESRLLTPGDELGIDDADNTVLGITTCYDLRFPELYRSLVDAGVDHVSVCSAWPKERVEHWRLFTTVRALEEQVNLFACNAVGTHGGVELAGASRVVTATGEVVAEAGEDEGFTIAELDANLPLWARAQFPALTSRRWPPSDAGPASVVQLADTRREADSE